MAIGSWQKTKNLAKQVLPYIPSRHFLVVGLRKESSAAMVIDLIFTIKI
jgi:hypothetical protein